MRSLATGQNCLPRAGIGAVSAQLAAGLPPSALMLGARVKQITAAADGDAASAAMLQLDAAASTVTARRAVVLAVEGPEAARLLAGLQGAALDAAPSDARPGVGTVCVYFAAPKAPRDEPILYLNGTGKGADWARRGCTCC